MIRRIENAYEDAYEAERKEVQGVYACRYQISDIRRQAQLLLQQLQPRRVYEG